MKKSVENSEYSHDKCRSNSDELAQSLEKTSDDLKKVMDNALDYNFADDEALREEAQIWA